MGFIFRSIVNLVRSARRSYGQITPRGKLQLAIVVGIIGLVAFGIGIYNTVDLTNKYNDLDSIPPPDPDALKQMSQADLMVVAQVGMAKRDLLARWAQASSVLGAGAVMLGLATLVFVSIPERTSSGPATASTLPANSAPATMKPDDAKTNATLDKPHQE